MTKETSLIKKVINNDCPKTMDNQPKSITNTLTHSYTKDGELIRFDPKDLDKNGEIHLPHNIKTINSYAFYMCKKLKGIVVPDSVKSIGMSAFNACTNLQRIVLPDNLENLGTRAFANCISLTDVKLPQNLIAIPYQCFLNCKNLRAITLPQNIELIYEQAFADCENLQKIDIPHNLSLRYLGFDVFLNSPIGKKFLRDISANSRKTTDNKKSNI